MKTAKYIVIGALVFLWVFYITPVILLHIPYIQKKISTLASEKFQEQLGVEVEIGSVDFEFFNKFILKDLYLEDQSGNTLFQAARVAAGFDFLPMLRGKLRFSSAQVFSFQLHLSKADKNAPLNLQFVIDAFSRKDSISKESNIDLKINNVNLRRGTFSYHIASEPETPGLFNAAHILLIDISAKIHLYELSNKRLWADIDRLSCTEHSGVTIKRLEFDFIGNDELATINHFQMQLPNSSLELRNMLVEYVNLNALQEYLNDAQVQVFILPSDITPQDLRPFLPLFSQYTDKVTIQGALSGSFDDFILEEFQLSDGNNMEFKANLAIKNLSQSEKTYIDGYFEQSHISPEGIRRLNKNLFPAETFPSELYNLGSVRFEGKLSGYLQRLSAFGLFTTDIGSLRTDIVVGKDRNHSYIEGKLSSNELDIKKLLNDNPDFGTAGFELTVQARRSGTKAFNGTTNAVIHRFDFKNYLHENIQMAGDFTQNSFRGQINIESPDGKLTAKGLLQLSGATSVVNFSAEAIQVKLDKLNLSQKYKESDLSFLVTADFTGNSVNNGLGYIDLTSLKFNTEKGGYYLDTLTVSVCEDSMKQKIIHLRSDLLYGQMKGYFQPSELIQAVSQTMHSYLPAIIPAPKKQLQNNNEIWATFTINKLDDLAYIFDLPFQTYNQTRITATYDGKLDKFELETYLPRFDINKYKFDAGKITLKNPGKKLELNANTSMYAAKSDAVYALSSKFEMENDQIQSSLSWTNNQPPKNNGTISFATVFEKPAAQAPLRMAFDMSASSVTINDSIWNIHPASVVIDSGRITIHDFFADHKNQRLHIKGEISPHPEDSLQVFLNQMDLDYIFNTLALSSIDFGGRATGHVKAQDLYQTRQLSTRLDVKDFSFNKIVFGDLDLNGIWDDQEKGITMLGYINKGDTGYVKVDGIIYPANQKLSIEFDAFHADISFLRRYMDKVAKNISGEMTGKIRLFGNFSDLTVSGNAYLKNASFGVDFLNTTYTFSDTVRMKPDEISMQNVNLYDKYGRSALVNGSVKHTYFSDFKFQASLQANNFLVYNATEKQNPTFYGTVFGTGTASIRGDESLVNIDVPYMQSNRNTRLELNFMGDRSVAEYDFINFVKKNNQKDTIPIENYLSLLSYRPVSQKNGSQTELKLNLNFEATPDANLEIIMDPVSGDRIKGNGRGNIQIQYGTRSPLNMFGRYAIDNGKYTFSFQQVLSRTFDIREGSTVTFQGDPYTANLDINASYNLTANLGDLSSSLITETARTNVPVSCILNIAGAIAHPDIRFDLEFPGSMEDLTRQVKSIVNTEDMMNRQIIYLLVLNKFFTIENGSESSRTRTNDFTSLASSTLSSQLSNILSSMSENVQIGTVFKTASGDSYTDTEVALLLSSQLLDNRLLINGNFGYRDNPYVQSAFVGDFDVEYKLTRSGEVRLKFYNHYDDRFYILRQPRSIQGLGIMLKKDFDQIKYLFSRRKPSFELLLEPSAIPNDTVSNPIPFF